MMRTNLNDGGTQRRPVMFRFCQEVGDHRFEISSERPCERTLSTAWKGSSLSGCYDVILYNRFLMYCPLLESVFTEVCFWLVVIAFQLETNYFVSRLMLSNALLTASSLFFISSHCRWNSWELKNSRKPVRSSLPKDSVLFDWTP